MQTKVVAFVAFLASLMAAVHGWAKLDDYDHNWSPSRRSWERLKEWYMRLHRNSVFNYYPKCVGSGNKCYATDQCCKGFVCAAFDDLFGLNPEIPGYCVREKDLQQCVTSAECSEDAKCLALGRAKTRYCVPRPEIGGNDGVAGKSNSAFSKDKNGLGVVCDDDTDCASFTKDGKDRLCCQEVRRYRQKAKRICDRITPISVCIPSRK